MVYYRDILGSRGYEYAPVDAPVIIRYGSYNVPAMEMDTDDEEQTVTFSPEGPCEMTIAHLLEIDKDELADILDYTVCVENDGEVFEAEDVFLDTRDDGQEVFVIFSD